MIKKERKEKKRRNVRNEKRMLGMVTRKRK